jgi:putative ABC transport system permease protein
LFGLSTFNAERRTKEIGIRKAVGADTGSIVRLFCWEFAKPILWANLIAWPVAYYFMNNWLNGFAYRIDLEFWIFLAAGAAALLIALATVTVQSLIAARQKPITALRYE